MTKGLLILVKSSEGHFEERLSEVVFRKEKLSICLATEFIPKIKFHHNSQPEGRDLSAQLEKKGGVSSNDELFSWVVFYVVVAARRPYSLAVCMREVPVSQVLMDTPMP